MLVPDTSPTQAKRRPRSTVVIGAAVMLLVGATIAARLTHAEPTGAASIATQGNVLVLALPAFLAGLLGFLSPCCLPILPTYFAFTFQARRERIVQMTFAFFLGLATTMVALGATASALSRLLFNNLEQLTVIGGLVIVGFGLMSLLGKGFSGLPILSAQQPARLGRTCTARHSRSAGRRVFGPILSALLTMLATQGATVLQGAALAFIYTLGLGAPLILSASLFSKLGPQSRLWRLMRGRGFAYTIGGTTLHLHTTSIASGLLLIVVGVLLATGQLAVFSQWAGQTVLTQRLLDLEEGMRVFLLGH